MKLTKQRLVKIIKEELEKVTEYGMYDDEPEDEKRYVMYDDDGDVYEQSDTKEELIRNFDNFLELHGYVSPTREDYYIKDTETGEIFTPDSAEKWEL